MWRRSRYKNRQIINKNLKENKMKSIEVYETVARARVGANLGDCMKDCIELAAKEWRNVTLVHNDKNYKVRTEDLISSITEEKEIRHSL